MIVLLISLIVSVLSRSQHQIPLVQTSNRNYYLSMRLRGPQSPRTLFAIDFNSSESYIDASIFPSLEVKKNHTLKIFTPKGRNLGSMNFSVLPTNISWVEHKGIIGLGVNSSFILMLENKLHKNISLRVQLISRALVIQSQPCRNPKTGPFKVSFQTWTTVNYMTPLSLNFRPSEDFLRLINKSQSNFQMNPQEYHQTFIKVGCEEQQRSVKLKRFVQGLSLDSSDNYQCSLNISQTPDVGLAIFSFPVKICKDGIDVGVTIIPTKSYGPYFMGILAANIALGIAFLNRKKIRACFAPRSHTAEEQE